MTVEERWAAFGERLSQLREASGLSGKRLAESVGWAASKVSRIQNAEQTITDTDVRTWCDATGVSDEERDELLAELRAIRLDQARWKSRLRRGHQPVQTALAQSEQGASTLRGFQTGMVPGLLQTPDYARAVFTVLAALKGAPNDADEAVSARMQRQTVLYDSTKRIELLVTEAALRSPIAPRKVMAAQYDRLMALIGARTIRFGIVPLDVGLPAPAMHGFSILDDLVTVEVLNTEVTTRDPDDVKMYADYLDAMWSVAAEGDEARAILSRLLA
ncbi:MAG: helix-turn-helix domain-containing protein [Haloechinothrix sp.]